MWISTSILSKNLSISLTTDRELRLSHSAKPLMTCSESGTGVSAVNARAEITEFIDGAKRDLGAVAECSGRVLYSSVDTLCPGRIYTLGINPGLDPYGLDYRTIRASLDDLPNYRKSAYRDESWDLGVPAGSDPLQQNWCWLMTQLGFNLDTVCASNIVFARTRGGIEARRYVAACWPVHERILRVVQPRYILAFGKLPLETITPRLRNLGLVDTFPARHQNWTCAVFSGEYDGRSVKVLGVPHLGRRYAYCPPLPMDVKRLARLID